jgi:hypothetical protein
MATKKKLKVSKERKSKFEAYVPQGLNITYSIPIGLTSMLATATKKSEKEVWCCLSQIASVCAARLTTRLIGANRNYADSWTTQVFPDSKVSLRLDMNGSKNQGSWVGNQWVADPYPKLHFHCRIKVSGCNTESFDQKDIDKYIEDETEKILLGIDEDEEQETNTIETDDELH